MFERQQKARLLRQVRRKYAEIIGADASFRYLDGTPYSPEDVADTLEDLFFRTKSGEQLTGPVSWELCIFPPVPFETTAGDGNTSGTVNGIVRLVGKIGETKRFIKFVSHPFYQYGTR